MTSLIRSIAAAALAGAALCAFTPQPLVLAAQALQSAEDAVAPERVTRLTVQVTGAASDAGAVWVGLYASQEAFDGGVEVASAMLPVSDAAAGAVFEDLKPGEYGVIAFHDANGDRDFNRNFIGMPQERYGFSNNPRPRFRGAHWEEAVFTLDGEAETVMQIELMGAGG